MPLLADYAITPDVFDITSYPTASECEARIELATQGRLVRHEPKLSAPPAHDRYWCAEALATHRTKRFTGGVIVTKAVKNVYAIVDYVRRRSYGQIFTIGICSAT